MREAPKRKLWSGLSDVTKRKYRKQGVTPQRYNAWEAKTPRKRKNLARKGVTRADFLGIAPPVTRRSVVDHVIKVLREANVLYSVKQIERGVSEMTAEERRWASDASYEQYARQAGVPADERGVNPTWYRGREVR